MGKALYLLLNWIQIPVTCFKFFIKTSATLGFEALQIKQLESLEQ